jgi:hypothetical protein
VRYPQLLGPESLVAPFIEIQMRRDKCFHVCQCQDSEESRGGFSNKMLRAIPQLRTLVAIN